ncbi:hypothetical protein GYH30_010100 [Glycine max]|nr:hypothetical protein GYH30_010100 [Glycine max]
MITRFSRVLHAAPDTPNAFIHDVSGLYDFLADTHRNDAIIQFPIPKVLHGAESGSGGSENDFGQSNIGGNESGETFMEGEREQLEEKESIGVKIYFGLRAQGNYNLTKRYNNNEVLKALYAEAGWTDEEDETTYCKNTPGNVTGEEQGQANRSYSRICKCGEMEGSEKVQKMLLCKSCGKKYHRNCFRSWSQNRGKKVHLFVYANK